MVRFLSRRVLDAGRRCTGGVGLPGLTHPLLIEPWHTARVRRRPVDSSSLASVGYSSTEQMLEVEFKHGAVYRYEEVPPDVFAALLKADSKGAFFNSDIKDSYDCVRVSR
jgi:hypothetical protein